MKTVEKIRFSVASQQAVKSTISEQCGIDIWELDTNAYIGTGSFSKPLSIIDESLYTTIERAKQLFNCGCKSDLLLRYVKNYHRVNGLWCAYYGWQVWERRQNMKHRRYTPSGSYMPRESAGRGKLYIM